MKGIIKKSCTFGVLTFIQLKYLSALMIMSTMITTSALAATPKAVLPCWSLKQIASLKGYAFIWKLLVSQ